MINLFLSLLQNEKKKSQDKLCKKLMSAKKNKSYFILGTISIFLYNITVHKRNFLYSSFILFLSKAKRKSYNKLCGRSLDKIKNNHFFLEKRDYIKFNLTILNVPKYANGWKMIRCTRHLSWAIITQKRAVMSAMAERQRTECLRVYIRTTIVF